MLGFSAIGKLAIGQFPRRVPAPVPDPGGDGDKLAKVSVQRIVVFEGSGSRVVIFEGSGSRVRFEQMSAMVPYKVGDKWVSNRDPDEESYYAADITQELIDRNTTARADGIELVLGGVTQLEEPSLEVATIDGVQRTFVVAFLGGQEGDPPDDWFWTARVRCANGERFDKTTHFNRVDG